MSPATRAARATADDEVYMRRCLELAERFRGRTAPNPIVGCVIVKHGKVLAEGVHKGPGQRHAEADALKKLGGKAPGATMYVNMEPCMHHGQTPPCVPAIRESGITRVVVGTNDPNPHVEGNGSEKLRAAGVEVTLGVRREEAEGVIAPWKKFVTRDLPFVSIKLALSLDGRIATRTGASRWVTGPDARARVHALRASCDAVAVGIGTVLSDDPRLNVRDAQGPSPTRIIFDTKLRTPPKSRLVQTASEIATVILTSADAPFANEEELTGFGVEIMRTPVSAEGRIDVVAAMTSLAQRGIVTLMVEGGAELAGSFLATKMADELHAFLAPILLGPRGRPGAVDWAGPDVPAKAPRIANPAWEVCGDDAHVFGRLVYPEE
ncbi:MAG TPA: bifunctional diaminohydroxyphosphoribosylaminopyrimidine deaminase/5-amino-6-(5-phosphoribosylamino)uracil reductase RibD [Polyangiaceae bacterium]